MYETVPYDNERECDNTSISDIVRVEIDVHINIKRHYRWNREFILNNLSMESTNILILSSKYK